MGKPTQQELEQALAEARRRIDEDVDTDGLGAVFLQQHRRYQYMAGLMQGVAEFFQRREDEHAHARLLRAAEQARQAEHLAPAETALRLALEQAARLRESGHDSHHLGKAMMNINYLFLCQERVWRAVEHYLRSGRAVTEHERLQQAYEQALRAEQRSAGEEQPTYGLDTE